MIPGMSINEKLYICPDRAPSDENMNERNRKYTSLGTQRGQIYSMGIVYINYELKKVMNTQNIVARNINPVSVYAQLNAV